LSDHRRVNRRDVNHRAGGCDYVMRARSNGTSGRGFVPGEAPALDQSDFTADGITHSPRSLSRPAVERISGRPTNAFTKLQEEIPMKKTFALVSALAIAMAFVPLTQSQAAHRHRHHKGPGMCGENMFWHHGHCIDARDKS
jgi:hypothetical protein